MQIRLRGEAEAKEREMDRDENERLEREERIRTGEDRLIASNLEYDEVGVNYGIVLEIHAF